MWLTSLVAPRHVGSSQTRARTRVPCIGRQTLNHCGTREALDCFFKVKLIFSLIFIKPSTTSSRIWTLFNLPLCSPWLFFLGPINLCLQGNWHHSHTQPCPETSGSGKGISSFESLLSGRKNLSPNNPLTDFSVRTKTHGHMGGCLCH